VKVGGIARTSIWVSEDGWTVEVIDQTLLPHEFSVRPLCSLADAVDAIATMRVRGAPLIGATAAYGICLQVRQDPSDAAIQSACAALRATRPTAVNLDWALGEMCAALRGVDPSERSARAYLEAEAICAADIATCRAIGEHGVSLIEAASERANGRTVNILTHCNAGWLATVDFGTALAPVYLAHDRGIAVHVWVDETRPRNQGANLTAWELEQHGVPHTLIADNAAGHVMQRGRVDLCITGSDRTTARGDVCNKIGTYSKALSARDNDVPFYVALPHSTIDWSLADGVAEIPIEERDGDELRRIRGVGPDGRNVEVRIVRDSTPVANYAFDVTPARLVTALVTERGVCDASSEGLLSLYPERR
jgi:methylthioribose-1-phosphate isomerase